MMICVDCFDCGEFFALRGWLESEDFAGSPFDNQLAGKTDEEIDLWIKEMEDCGRAHYDEKGVLIVDDVAIPDPITKFLEVEQCPACGSKNVNWI